MLKTASPNTPEARSLTPTFGLISLVFVVSCLYIFLISPINRVDEGLGWDGIHYANMVTAFELKKGALDIDDYYVGRLLPSAIVQTFLRLLAYEVNPPNIIRGFRLWNLISHVLAFVVYLRFCRVRNFSPAACWLGFSALFLGYVHLTQLPLFPVQTDQTAFLLSLSSIYYYLVGRKFPLFVLALLGAFVWPTATQLNALLILLPDEPPPLADLSRASKVRRLMRYSLIALTAAIVAATPLLIIAAPVLSLYLFFCLSPFCRFDLVALPRFIFCRRNFPRDLAGVVSILLFRSLASSWLTTGHQVPRTTAFTFLKGIFFYTPIFPGSFYVAHCVYLGPIFVLLFLFRFELEKLLWQAPAGSIAFGAALILLSCVSESRLLSYGYPFLVLVLCGLLSGKPLSTRFTAVFVLLSVLSSKAYLPISHWLGNGAGNTRAFPQQAYFMNFGPWMSRAGYAIGCVELLISYWVLSRMLRDDLRSAPAT